MSAADVRNGEAFRSLMTETSAQWPRALDEVFSIHEVGTWNFLAIGVLAPP
jgi:hypothetical protein